MKQRIICKTLAVAVILLFIGVGVQPAIAIIPDKSENDKDCNLCAENVSNQHISRIKNLIDKIEENKNKVSILSKNNPEFNVKYKEVYTRFLVLKEISENNIFYWNFPVICSLLLIFQFSLILVLIIAWFFIRIYHDFPFVEAVLVVMDGLGFAFNCPWYDPPPHLKIINKI